MDRSRSFDLDISTGPIAELAPAYRFESVLEIPNLRSQIGGS